MDLPSMFTSLIEMRNFVAEQLGECGATDAVSRAVLARIRTAWIKSKPRTPKVKSPLAFLDEEYFQNVIKREYDDPILTPSSDIISAIKRLREQYEWEEAGKTTRLGLSEAKQYVEYLCRGEYRPVWMK